MSIIHVVLVALLIVGVPSAPPISAADAPTPAKTFANKAAGDFTFSAAAQPIVNNGVPGRTVSFTHTLTNSSDEPDTFTFAIVAPSGWTAAPLEPLTLAGGESREVVVMVLVPNGQGVGSYTIDVSAQSSISLTPQTHTDTAVVVGVAVPALSPGQTRIAGWPQPTTVSFTHVLTNIGNQAGTFLLSVGVVGSPAGWSAAPSQPSCSLVQNASCTFTVNVTVPAGAAAGLTGVAVTASYGGPPPASDSVTDFVRGSSFTFSAATQPAVSDVVPGQTVSFTHTLTNHSDTADTFTIVAAGGLAAAPLDPLTLAGGESREVLVQVQVPDGQGAGSYTIDVSAQSSSRPVSQTHTDTVDVVDAALPALSPGQTQDASLPLPTTVTFTHVLTNTGNQAGTFSLSAGVVGSPAGWSAAPSQPSCSLVQNASCTFTVNVTVPAGAAAGLTGVAVTASYGGPPPASDSVTDFVRTPQPVDPPDPPDQPHPPDPPEPPVLHPVMVLPMIWSNGDVDPNLQAAQR